MKRYTNLTSLFLSLMALLSGSFARADQTLYLVGASTLDEHQKWVRSNIPYASWGRALEPYLKDGWVIENNAYSGKSVKSALESPVDEVGGLTLWAYTINSVKAGDYVIIQFGHNDMKTDSAYYSTPAEYKAGLAQMAADVKAHGATPVFVTSIRRAQFRDGVLYERPIGENVLGDYAQAMREIAAEIGVEVVDLHTLTGDYLSSLGQEKSEELYVGNAKVDLNGEGEYDVTHPVAAGALAYSWLFYNEVKSRSSGISSIFKENAHRNYVPVKPYSNDKTVTISVGPNQSQLLLDALDALGMTLSEFKKAKYERLVKTGEGTLVMNQDIQTCALDVFVESGTLSVQHKDALGQRGSDLTNGFVVVRNGATLEWAVTATYSAKRVYFEGTGVGGNGALITDNLSSGTAKYWQNVVFVATGNATTYAGGASRTPALFYGSEVYLNGFTNTVLLGVKTYAFGPLVKDGGVIVFPTGLVEFRSEIVLPEDPLGVARIICDGCKVNLSAESYPNIAWPLAIAQTPGSFQVNSSGTEWFSPIEVFSGATLNYAVGATFKVRGGLLGEGNVAVTGSGTLELGVVNELFAGTLSARNGGAVRMPTTQRSQDVWPGLVAGYVAGVKGDSFVISGHKISEWSSNLPEMPTLTNAVETTFQRLTGAQAVPGAPEGANCQVYTYSGYLVNSSETAEVWAVEVNLKHYVDLQIGGTTTLFKNWRQYDDPRVAKVTLQPGANRFSLKSYVSGAAGGLANVTGSNGKKYPGLGYIRNPTQSIEDLSDTSKTSSKVWTTVESDETGALFRCAKDEAEVRSLSAAGLIDQPLSAAFLRRLSLSSDAELLVDGCETVVSNLTGVGSITQSAGALDGNALTVVGEWTVSSEDYAANQMLRSDVKVVFGADSKIVLDYGSVVRGARVQPVAVSAVGIEGIPQVAFTDGLSHPVRLQYSAETKTLFVDSSKLFAIFVVR